jgi:hypothetical protein
MHLTDLLLSLVLDLVDTGGQRQEEPLVQLLFNVRVDHLGTEDCGLLTNHSEPRLGYV